MGGRNNLMSMRVSSSGYIMLVSLNRACLNTYINIHTYIHTIINTYHTYIHTYINLRVLVSEKYIHTYKGIYLIGPLDLRVLKNLRTSSVYKTITPHFGCEVYMRTIYKYIVR